MLRVHAYRSIINFVLYSHRSNRGIGLEAVNQLLGSPENVVIATCRKPLQATALAQHAESAPGRLHVLELDVSQPADVARAFAYAERELGRLDVVYNNAGVRLVGQVEPLPGGGDSETERAARALFEVNFWGALHVMQEAVTFFREVNPHGVGGRVLNCSSGAGILAPPGAGYYAAR